MRSGDSYGAKLPIAMFSVQLFACSTLILNSSRHSVGLPQSHPSGAALFRRRDVRKWTVFVKFTSKRWRLAPIQLAAGQRAPSLALEIGSRSRRWPIWSLAPLQQSNKSSRLVAAVANWLGGLALGRPLADELMLGIPVELDRRVCWPDELRP